MFRVYDNNLRKVLSECNYLYPDEVYIDVRSVKSLYTDLHLYLANIKDDIKKLLNMSGTIPVEYKGETYNIPICIWLHNTHPSHPPKCFVKPTSNMTINVGKYVDHNGIVNLPYLDNWKRESSHLLGLLKEMRAAFQRETPLFSKTVYVQPVCSPPLSQDSEYTEKKERPENFEELFKSLHIDNILSAYKLEKKEQVADKVARQEEHIITVNNLSFPVQVKKYENIKEDVLVPSCIPEDKCNIFQRLLTLEERSFTVEDIIEAIEYNKDYESALKYLSHECPICNNQVSFSKIVTMTHCSCAFCEVCFRAYFSIVIKEKSIVDVVCPLCRKPDIKAGGSEVMDYFNLLDTQIKHYLGEEIQELFQRKLRDRALLQMPNFCWCAHCSFGLLHESQSLRMDCPSCGRSTCFKCHRPWLPQHTGISCEQFIDWQNKNSLGYQDAQLEHLYSRNGIDCPNCRVRFHLSKGGCLHFKCTQCQHEFCGGCRKPFLSGEVCSFSEDCRSKGLHAHHPRNCFYFLRDWDVKRLQHLLNVQHIYTEFGSRWYSTRMCRSKLQLSFFYLTAIQYGRLEHKGDSPTECLSDYSLGSSFGYETTSFAHLDLRILCHSSRKVWCPGKPRISKWLCRNSLRKSRTS
ncbi:E3 ubiquitin-protein ligase lubel-like isoform X2 [Polypterus senegalus]|uniref:E3 ubiquitin-protein ligase lubel-like isoform X2 n=1 Tax=Polypterus senegalus TaxID=55291 RepID=UPI001963F403|nr:E3 ubiquitin-protein ligase lubel-like isoform X2 [Polypterus senegalus]